MATGNFIDGTYGIFVLPTLSAADAVEHLTNEGIEITDSAIHYEIGLYEGIMVEDFPIHLEEALSAEGVSMHEDDRLKRYECYDDNDRIIARLELRGGYYSGVQVLVEGDPEELLGDYYYEESYLEDYSPDIEPVLTALRGITTEYRVFARFSNGETIYTKAKDEEE